MAGIYVDEERAVAIDRDGQLERELPPGAPSGTAVEP